MGEARAMALAARNRDLNRAERQANRDRELEHNIMAQMQMAMHMSEVENRINERQMIMMAMH